MPASASASVVLRTIQSRSIDRFRQQHLSAPSDAGAGAAAHALRPLGAGHDAARARDARLPGACERLRRARRAADRHRCRLTNLRPGNTAGA
eukprot:6184235-Pleurochrysis_carterae.AAC.2